MKKTLFLLLALSVTVSVMAQPDTLTYTNDYYNSKRNVEELIPVTKHNIVMLGNSITERGFWSEYFQKSRVLNRGIGGDCVSGMIARVDPIVAGEPKAIFIMAGVNDLIFSKITPEYLLKQYERLLDIIRTRSPKTKIYIQSLLPLDESMNTQYFTGKNARIVVFNTLLKEMAVRRGLTYIDIWSKMVRDGKMPFEYTVDGIHLKAAGYAVWIELLRPYIK